MSDELFPPRKGTHINPHDSVNEVLDTMAAVGWDMRHAMTPKSNNEESPVGTFREFWRECPECQKRTRWSFTQMPTFIDGFCEECDYTETFGAWDEVIKVVDER